MQCWKTSFKKATNLKSKSKCVEFLIFKLGWFFFPQKIFLAYFFIFSHFGQILHTKKNKNDWHLLEWGLLEAIFFTQENLRFVLGNLDFALEWDNPKSFWGSPRGKLVTPSILSYFVLVKSLKWQNIVIYTNPPPHKTCFTLSKWYMGSMIQSVCMVCKTHVLKTCT